MPAVKRYRGRFYAEFTEAERQRPMTPRHHAMILSGLYGLLHPAKHMQAYSCHLDDHGNIGRTWTQDAVVTTLLLAYAAKYGMRLIFDLTGEGNYRAWIDWPQICSEVRVEDPNAWDSTMRALKTWQVV
jgi:cytoplasmic iron level regulating protein YaaA (DUF328/UPF0246 family)